MVAEASRDWSTFALRAKISYFGRAQLAWWWEKYLSKRHQKHYDSRHDKLKNSKNDFWHKTLFFLKLNPFSGGKLPNLMTCSLQFCDVIYPKLEELPDSNFASGMLYGHNDSCQVSFQSVDVNIDFWHLALWTSPNRPGERMRRPGLTGSKVRMLRTTILHSWIKVAGAGEGQPILDDVDRLQLHGTIYRPDSFVLMLRYFANLKAIRYESTSSKES